MNYIDDAAILDEQITSLELELTTVDANDAASNDFHYVNIVFSDGTRLYEPLNLGLYEWVEGLDGNRIRIGTLPKRGERKRYTLPVPTPLGRTLRDIAEIFIRKNGSDGWFVGSVLLFANGHELPLLGNRNANQFLDNDHDVLRLRDWSTRSLCVAPTTRAQHPLPPSGYRVLGPVIGQVSDRSAIVLYRVDREGIYRFRAFDAITRDTVHNETQPLEPTGQFQLRGLEPNRRYEFDLSFVRNGVESPVPDAAGSLTTYPPEGSFELSRGRFTFAFGSCVNPREQEGAQGSWTAIRALAETPPTRIDPVRLFVHLGDTFYFYDNGHVTEEVPPRNVESMRAAHVSMRRNIEFLDMARVVPSCGIWDDHDFAGNDKDSTSIPDLLMPAAKTWLQYWGNQLIFNNGMEEHRVVCIVHDEKQRITHVGLEGGEIHTVSDIIRLMNNGHLFFTQENNIRANVFKRTHPTTGRKYLTTNPDDTNENNLDFLPQWMGLTTRISHGLVDIYLLDGRFRRDKSKGVYFGNDIIDGVLEMIDRRGDKTPHVVVLGSGSSWNHQPNDNEEGYGQREYKHEREMLYNQLARRMGRTIHGLLLISGDYHYNEIYHVKLGESGRMAPEFISSPLTKNTGGKGSRDIEKERVWSHKTAGDNGKRGFATLTIDTSSDKPDNWTATVRYFQEAAAARPYESRSYILCDGQFHPHRVGFDQVIVPDVRLEFVESAFAIITDKGLVPKIIDGPNNDRAWVLDQSPSGGQTVPRCRTVELTTSDLPPP
jgi:hypothetical protein